MEGFFFKGGGEQGVARGLSVCLPVMVRLSLSIQTTFFAE